MIRQFFWWGHPIDRSRSAHAFLGGPKRAGMYEDMAICGRMAVVGYSPAHDRRCGHCERLVGGAK
jgi:hypothetical protein